MAITVASVVTVFDGPVRIRYATITMDSSYATSGEAVTAAQFGLQSLDAVFPAGGARINVAVDSTGLKFLAYKTNTSTNTNTTFADIGAQEVPSATDLSAISFKVLAVGH